MKFTFPRAVVALSATLLSVSAIAGEPEEKNASNAAQEQVDTAETKAAPEQEAKEEKRICRYIRLDTSSRRKTKVCRTEAEWRELNNIR